ncbi:D-ribose pyranase [Jiangella asiatica]|uniref:D-ribose pyranase n=1 Tax=Jiangella asiatica TaxID=2530372 RepID=A0A4R5D584_9ACTN|nr:D-ribose pyranase [Jiangella asiatica]TDE08619.1 D-ribose pyranase [Jiangella asiatica]
MRADGLWHPRLAGLVAGFGHTQTLVVADPGLPVPTGVECVDLVWARNEPRMLPVLAAVLGELVVESATWASEADDPGLLAGLERLLGARTTDRIPHDELKRRVAGARAVVRTGEATPYANVILTAGVPF